MKKAFTLAEVLITLAIIGIVAALTIPSVISNYQQQEFKTGLKKAVSVLNEAIQTNIAQEGETPYENYNLYDYLKRHMNILKTSPAINSCYDSNGNFTAEYTAWNCAGDNNSLDNRVFYTSDGMRFEIPLISWGEGSNLSNKKTLKLHETGVKLAFKGYNSYTGLSHSKYHQECEGNTCHLVFDYAGCGSYGLSKNPNQTKETPCLIVVDVNGDRKPNYPQGSTTIFERKQTNATAEYTYPSPTDKKLQDVFTIMITEKEAIPFGVVAQRAMYSSK